MFFQKKKFQKWIRPLMATSAILAETGAFSNIALGENIIKKKNGFCNVVLIHFPLCSVGYIELTFQYQSLKDGKSCYYNIKGAFYSAIFSNIF